MEILRINSAKLKITLTRAECEAYDIKETDGDFDSVRVRDALNKILDEADALDFYSGSEKLLVQLYPKDGGGAELFITKLSQVGERERKAVSRSQNLATYSKGYAHFSFDSRDDLVRAARAVRNKSGASDLYTDREGVFILSVEENKISGMSDCDVLSEFGTRLPQGSVRLCEEWYDLVIKDNAIEQLREL